MKQASKPTNEQELILNRSFSMTKDWFDSIFKPGSFLVERPIIYFENEGEEDECPVYAEVYAKPGIGGDEKTIYCFYIHFSHRAWQASDTTGVSDLIDSIQTEHAWDQYQYKSRMAKGGKSIGRKKAA